MRGQIKRSELIAVMLKHPDVVRPEPKGPYDINRPGGLFEKMVQSIVGYCVKGVI